MTSVVGVYLLSGSARLVHMWVSVCVQACLVGREQEWGGNGITALCPECCCRPRGEEGEICIKTKFFEGWAVLNRPITTRSRVRIYSPPFERARCSKKWPLRFISMKEVRRENVTVPFSAFLILCNQHDFAHRQFCCLPWRVTLLCCCWGLFMQHRSRGNRFGKCELESQVSGKRARKQA